MRVRHGGRGACEKKVADLARGLGSRRKGARESREGESGRDSSASRDRLFRKLEELLRVGRVVGASGGIFEQQGDVESGAPERGAGLRANFGGGVGGPGI